MELEPLIQQISVEAGLGENVTPHRSNILRNLQVVLEEMDSMVNWRCSIVPFSKTINANDNKALVSNVNLFKPIICRFVDSDSVERPLTYRELTNYWIEDADWGTDTNDFPTIYTIAGGYIYVGPGIMDASTTITGFVRRRLTENDVAELPASMLVDGTVKRITKAGSPESIRAWSGWNASRNNIILAAKKHTGEERDVQPLDPVISRNINYLSSL
jgi:hypothetical protein